MRSHVAGLVLVLALAGCGGDDAPAASSATTTSTPPPEPTAAPAADRPRTESPTTPTSPPGPSTTAPASDTSLTPDGRAYPAPPTDATALAARLAVVERELRDLDPVDPAFADLAHEQQVVYRRLGRDDALARRVREAMPPDLAATVGAHVAARQAIGRIPHGDPPENVPAWEIVPPLPVDELRAIYESAGAATGIHWSYLAAVNQIETGFGRIVGLSTAGAQGPMQFLPTTWDEVGEGSIDDPTDAIHAAARYLVRRGGPDDMDAALWGYNNSDAYVEAVSTYAGLFRDDPTVLGQTHAWEIHYGAALADLWLPVGYRQDEPVPAIEYVAEAPWSLPPDG